MARSPGSRMVALVLAACLPFNGGSALAAEIPLSRGGNGGTRLPAVGLPSSAADQSLPETSLASPAAIDLGASGAAPVADHAPDVAAPLAVPSSSIEPSAADAPAPTATALVQTPAPTDAKPAMSPAEDGAARGSAHVAAPPSEARSAAGAELKALQASPALGAIVLGHEGAQTQAGLELLYHNAPSRSATEPSVAAGQAGVSAVSLAPAAPGSSASSAAPASRVPALVTSARAALSDFNSARRAERPVWLGLAAGAALLALAGAAFFAAPIAPAAAGLAYAGAAILGATGAYALALSALSFRLPRFREFRAKRNTEAAALRKLDASLQRMGLPPARVERVRQRLSPDRPTVALLAPASVYKLSVAREGGRQSPGDVHLALDPSWYVQKRLPDGTTRLLLKKGLYFDAEGRAVIAQYDYPRPAHYFANYYTLDANDRDDGVPLEESLDSPMSSSSALEQDVNDKLLTTVLMAARGIAVPATLAFAVATHPLAQAQIRTEHAAVDIQAAPDPAKPAAEERARMRGELERFLARTGPARFVVKPSGPQWHSSRGVRFFARDQIEEALDHELALLGHPNMGAKGSILVQEFIESPSLRMSGGTLDKAGRLKDYTLRLLVSRTPWNDFETSSILARVSAQGKPTVVEPGGPGAAFDPEDAAVPVPLDAIVAGLRSQHGLLATDAEAAEFAAELEALGRDAMRAFGHWHAGAPDKGARQGQTDFAGLDVMLRLENGRLRPYVIEVNDHDSGGQFELDRFHPDREGQHSRTWVATMLARARRHALRGKRIVVVGSGYKSSKSFIFENARRLGVEVVLVDLPGSWAADKAYSSHYVPVDTADPAVDPATGRKRSTESALAAIRALEKRIGPVDGVTAFWEDDLFVTAELAKALGKPFASPEGAQTVRNKRLALEALAAAGVPVSRRHRANTPEELQEAIASVGFPAVLKPASGAAAFGVVTVQNAAEAREAHARLVQDLAREAEHDSIYRQGTDIVMQQYIKGPGKTEVDVDIVVQGGKILFSSVTDNWPTEEPNHLATGSNLPSRLSHHAQAKAAKQVERISAALGMVDGVYHVEGVVDDASGEFTFIEFNGRPGGYYVVPWVQRVTGVDLIEQLFLVAAGIPVHPFKSPKPLEHLSGRFIEARATGKIAAAGPAAPLPAGMEVFWYRGPGDFVEPPYHSRVAMLVASGRSLDETDAVLQANSRFDVSVWPVDPR
ncbi:MAG TPA: ATP-grasp domain-containing protein [Elusimicrobiota bacterium]|nr:ATP-grasp domain-containing protein [Elusimicrobiota bacterium]